MSQKKSLLITSVSVVILLAAAIVAYLLFFNKQAAAPGGISDIDTDAITANLQSLKEQDAELKSIKTVNLAPKAETGDYDVTGEGVTTFTEEQQQANKYTLENGALLPLEDYKLSKQAATTDAPDYNAAFFVYKVEGAASEDSTDKLIKAQLDARITAAAEKYKQQFSAGKVSTSQATQVSDLSLDTTDGKKIKLAANQFEISVEDTNVTTAEKEPGKASFIVGGAKIGSHVVIVAFANQAQSQFGKEKQNFTDIARYVQLRFEQ